MSPALLAESLKEQPPYVIGLLILGIVLVSASMLLGLRNRKRKASNRLSARDTLERVKQKEGLKRDLEALAVEIEELARRVGAQLDNKAARIEKLLDEADATLVRLDHARTNLLTPGNTNGPSATSPMQSREAHSEPGRAGPAPDGIRTEKTGSTRAGSRDVASAPSSSTTDAVPTRLTADTYRLADAGLSPEEIARSVGEDVGKIELILALRSST